MYRGLSSSLCSRSSGHIPSLSSNRGHVTGKHVLIGCKRDKFCLQSFEVGDMFMHVFQEWRQDRISKTFSKKIDPHLIKYASNIVELF